MTGKIDRRRYPRLQASKPVKLRFPGTDRYLTGQTNVISANGTLVQIVQSAALLARGQRLLVGIAWNHQQMLIYSDNLVEATVARSVGMGDGQLVAIEFDHVLKMALSA